MCLEMKQRTLEPVLSVRSSWGVKDVLKTSRWYRYAPSKGQATGDSYDADEWRCGNVNDFPVYQYQPADRCCVPSALINCLITVFDTGQIPATVIRGTARSCCP